MFTCNNKRLHAAWRRYCVIILFSAPLIISYCKEVFCLGVLRYILKYALNCQVALSAMCLKYHTFSIVLYDIVNFVWTIFCVFRLSLSKHYLPSIIQIYCHDILLGMFWYNWDMFHKWHWNTLDDTWKYFLQSVG